MQPSDAATRVLACSCRHSRGSVSPAAHHRMWRPRKGAASGRLRGKPCPSRRGGGGGRAQWPGAAHLVGLEQPEGLGVGDELVGVRADGHGQADALLELLPLQGSAVVQHLGVGQQWPAGDWAVIGTGGLLAGCWDAACASLRLSPGCTQQPPTLGCMTRPSSATASAPFSLGAGTWLSKFFATNISILHSDSAGHRGHEGWHSRLGALPHQGTSTPQSPTCSPGCPGSSAARCCSWTAGADTGVARPWREGGVASARSPRLHAGRHNPHTHGPSMSRPGRAATPAGPPI